LISPSNGAMSTNLNYLPFVSEIAYVDTATTYQQSYNGQDVFSILSSCYALMRGGVRIKVNSTSVSPNSLAFAYAVPIMNYALPSLINFNWASAPLVGAALGAMRPSATFRQEVNGGVEVEHPFYCRTHSASCGDLLNAPLIGNAIRASVYGPVPRVVGNIQYTTAPNSTPQVYRAGSEDCSFGLFVSIPPIAGWVQNFTG
jgi:hypothetical protein